MKPAPKGNFVPPSDRPKWEGDDKLSSDLLYLGWGRRYHGKNPPPPYRHPGWLYILLLSGSPVYHCNEQAVTASPGDLIIVDPECAFGVTDRLNAHCTWLLWIWKEAPSSGLVIPTGGYELLALTDQDAKQVEQIHNSCRAEVATLDAYTDASLRLYHQMLDISVRRSQQMKRERAAQAHLVQMGVNWLKQNITTREPVKLLCEYLQISPATLSRLFTRNLKISPARYHQGIRMEWAQQELKRGRASIKEVAYNLGFKHPGDFTRAYRTYYATLPKETKSNLH